MEKPLWERDSFFKVMIGDFQRRLRIPPSFQNLLRRAVPVVDFMLRSRGGREWAVKLKRENGGLFFGEGWDGFVADLAIGLGEFLIFVYDGYLGFDVKIYGITGCEKEECTAIIKKEEILEDEVKGQSDKSINRLFQGRKRNREVVNGHVILEGNQVFNNKRALESARSFKSTRPFFIATCRSSRENYMTIPRSFEKECKLRKMNDIILQDSKWRTWPVRIADWRGRVALATGWAKFRDGNYLEEGDVCVFEFLQANYAIRVHIFRVKEYDVPDRRKIGNRKRHTRTYKRKVKSKGLEAEKSFRTVESFASVCIRSRKYNLNIPKYVLKENDATNIHETILYDACGRSFSVQISHRADGRLVLARGWSKFWNANNIQEGDICIFRHAGGIHEMTVQIHRAGLLAITAG
ncbi:Putative B3 domain-containing protein [Apostasia shenzhenica]|uniref:B3 domain-containing protein n=1 Tax=Apostasia shenzhenica TaxID=1088818 RepID=A0A2I0APC9_9ASPA|nr:Putative B3 domain-containing protein [Apostasia shenzhenica]